MKRNFLLSILLGLFITFQLQAAEVWYVNQNAVGNQDGSSWSNAFINLQDAISAATADDSIFVAKGTYYPTVMANASSTNPRDKTFLINKPVKIYGGFVGNEADLASRANDSTSLYVTNASVLSGDLGIANNVSDNVYHVMITTNNSNGFMIDGFTISHGNANDETTISVNATAIPRNAGAGVYNSASNGTFNNVVVSDNQSQSASNMVGGGAGMLNTDSEITMTNFTFINNVAGNSNGGGMNNHNSSTVMSNGWFINNEASGSDQGGGAMNNDNGSDCIITDVIFESNVATNGSGGAVYNDNSSPEFTRVQLLNNSSGKSGGGVDCDGGSDAVFNEVLFKGNHADEDGGGLYAWKSSVTMHNVQFYENSADGNGGGMYHYNTCFPMISNADISHNTAGGSFGGIGVERDSELVLTNTLVSKNTASFNGGGLGTEGLTADAILTNVTIVNNTAPIGGGGYSEGVGSKIRNSIIIGNTPYDLDIDIAIMLNVRHTIYTLMSPPIYVENGSINPYGDTLINGWPVLIDTLNENYLIDPTGPAFDMGDASFFATNATPNLSMITKDLRGANRIMGMTIDIGAYEHCTDLFDPEVSIMTNSGTTVNDGESVTFSAVDLEYEGENPDYQWMNNGNNITGATSETYTAIAGTDFVDGDAISVKMTSSEPCVEDPIVVSNEIEMTVLPVSIEEVINESSNIQIVPNPNHGEFVISGQLLNHEFYQITIADLLGRVVYQEELEVLGQEIKIQISKDLPAGIYMLSLSREQNGQQTIKFLKK